ncbi:MAG TPA: MFS transporter, partial [Gaiellaceae bacterium]
MQRARGIGMRAAVGGVGVALAVGWNITALGAIATRLAHAYGVGLATIGLFTTVQFVVHMLMQIPGGRAADRFGARRTALLGLACIAAGNAVALPVADTAFGFLGRA